MPNFIDEYLVRLGTSVDQAGIGRFHQALREVTAIVDTTAIGMTSAMLKAQTEVVGGFTAIGASALGLVDKVAMADQQYRLFALHMYMSKDAARGLKVAMDALGEPLENLTWDPELRGRAIQLMEDQRKMAPAGDFNAQMHKIRDIRFEFTRMEVELQYLTMHVVQDFLHALGTGPDQLLARLRAFNAWIIKDLPQISQWVTTRFIPVWKDTEHVFEDIGIAIRDTGVAFTNFVGLLTGDSAIMGVKFSLDKFAEAMQRVVHIFAVLTETMADFEDLIARVISALALLAHGDFSAAGAELKGGLKDINARTIGATIMAGSAFLAPELLPEEAEAGGAAGLGTRLLGRAAGFAKSHYLIAGTLGANLGSAVSAPAAVAAPPSTSVPGVSPDIWSRLSAGTGGYVPAQLLQALAYVESGAQGMAARSSKGAIGTMQLMPSTAAEYGVDPYSLMGNLRGGTALLRDLMRHYGGSTADAIGAYNWGQGNMDRFLAGKATLPLETRNEIARVMARMGARGSVQVGSVTIHITDSGDPQRTATAVVHTLRNAGDKRVQRNLSEFASYGYSY